MSVAIEYKELYFSADEFYIMDNEDINLEEPFIEKEKEKEKNREEYEIEEFNKIATIENVKNNNIKKEKKDIGVNTEVLDSSLDISLGSSSSIGSNMGCGKILKCGLKNMCVIS
jgi:primase-polymerase (primpol)-like protein